MSAPTANQMRELLAIMQRLRDECPWDRAQTPHSLTRYAIEEAYEVEAAIRAGNTADICDELGDLLLQVVFQARMFEQQGAFNFDDVVNGLMAKMIRRHPHIFEIDLHAVGAARYEQSAQAIWGYVAQHVRGQGKGVKVPQAEFPLMPIDDAMRIGLLKYLPEYQVAIDEVVISGAALKHIYNSRGDKLASEMLAKLLNGHILPDQILPNHQEHRRVLALYENFRPESKVSKDAMMALGLSVEADKVTVYNFMPVKKGTIRQAKEYAEQLAQESRHPDVESGSSHLHSQNHGDTPDQAHVAGENFQRSEQVNHKITKTGLKLKPLDALKSLPIDAISEDHVNKIIAQQWDAIKQAERGGVRRRLDDIKAGAALMQAQNLQKQAAKVGFDWPDLHGAQQKLHEELAELDAAIASQDPHAMADELGDCFFSLVNVARKLGIDSESATLGTVYKFRQRFAFIEDRLMEKAIMSSSLKCALRSDWQENFPDALILYRARDVQTHVDYIAAKQGNTAAAYRLIVDMVQPQDLIKMQQLAQSAHGVVAVHAEEQSGRNKIPLALAAHLEAHLGLCMDTDIIQIDQANRGAATGLERLVRSVGFSGNVVAGQHYLIVDDTLTQGGTLADLKGYIESHGGMVVGAVALMGKQYSAKLKPSAAILALLRQQAGADFEQWWQHERGYNFDRLTESEANFLYTLITKSSAESVRDRVVAARQASGRPSTAPTVSAASAAPITDPFAHVSLAELDALWEQAKHFYRQTDQHKTQPKLQQDSQA